MKKLLVLLLVISSSAVLSFSQETFFNKQWGFTMQAPKSWLPAGKAERMENIENFDISEQALAKVLESEKGSTFIGAFYKYDRKTTSGLIPSIQIEARKKPPVDFQTFKAQLLKSSARLKTVFPDIVFGEPEDVQISGIRSVMVVAKFTMTHVDGQILRARSTVYAIPLKNYFFQVTFNDGQEPEHDCTSEFLSLRKTIQIRQ